MIVRGRKSSSRGMAGDSTAMINAALPDFERVVEETGILKPKPYLPPGREEAATTGPLRGSLKTDLGQKISYTNRRTRTRTYATN
jgi:hypothetical protein